MDASHGNISRVEGHYTCGLAVQVVNANFMTREYAAEAVNRENVCTGKYLLIQMKNKQNSLRTLNEKKKRVPMNVKR